ncbi:PREDICTED: vacuolar protein sorting-associated protein 13A-like, partial [Rhagoletis zephyria]|uniref:vacuolar protein sorting-associated protein 13A-like n=1 Tax=Rhagoletis zephyria TaxID=28612 RepID=UPI0008119937
MGDLPEGKMPAFVDTAVRFTGLTLAEINGTLFKLDYFERTQWACSNEELIKAIAHHYALQIAAQLYKLILGLDIIGNPGKLASDITRGVGDFFYEPAAGIVVGPEEFAEGVATGVHSLTTNLVGGTAAALGRIGHRLGTGVAALSADEKFQKERRERTNKEATFSASGKHLVRGFVDGVSGLVSKPVEGAQRSGFGGLLRGVGQGLVGVIVQPATGVLDAAATGLHAFNNSIDAKTVARAARPPRHFPAGSKLLPYNLYAAIGNQHLRTLADGKYAAEGEEYEYHLQLDGQRMVLLSTTKIFYLEKSMFAGAWEIDWSEDWMN